MPGYLTKLVTAALNSTFTAVDAASATKPINLSIANADKICAEQRANREIKKTKPINIRDTLRRAIYG